MGWHLRKRIKIVPGVYLNLSKTGTSWSVGPRGAKINFGGKRETYVSAGIPGTGIYFREKVDGKKKHKRSMPHLPGNDTSATNGWFVLLFYSSLLLFIIALVNGCNLFLITLATLAFVASVILFNSPPSKGENGDACCKNVGIAEEDMAEDNKQEDVYEPEKAIENADNIGREVLSDYSSVITMLDPLFKEAAQLVVAHQQGSSFLIQRKFSISYNRAGRIIDQLECVGIVGKASAIKAMDVLCKNEKELEYKLNHISEETIEILQQREEASHKHEELAETSQLIRLGSDLEKEGMTDEAISIYEKAIISRIPATVPYNRLMVLYRKKKDYENEIRVIQTAIEVFMAENERRAGRVVEEDGSLYEMVMQALETNENIQYENGKWAFVQYDVMEYITRLEKAKSLLAKSLKQRQTCKIPAITK